MAKAKGTWSEMDNAKLTSDINPLELKVRHVERTMETLLDIHERLKGLTKLPEVEQRQLLASGLSSMPVGGDAWMAIMLLLEKARAIEHMAAKRPGISNDDRNFNTGRESALEDFEHILMQAKAEASTQEEGE